MQIARYEAHLHAIMTTIISPNLKRESVRIDTQGNEINPRTKQVINPAETEYVAPPVTPPEAQNAPVAVVSYETAVDIQSLIIQAENEVVRLKELKRQKIADMKKQLEDLEK